MYRHCQDFGKARMYPGLPEYVNQRGRGVYPWLTGSASWYLLTLLTEVFGVRGDLGDLVLDPKLASVQFDPNGEASVRTQFAGRQLEIVYRNPRGLDCAAAAIRNLTIDGEDFPLRREGGAALVSRAAIAGLADGRVHQVLVDLAPAI